MKPQRKDPNPLGKGRGLIVCVEANGFRSILIQQVYAYVNRIGFVQFASSRRKVMGRTNAVQNNIIST